MVLNGVLSDAGTEGNEGEKAPDVARILSFKLTVRDIYNGFGCFVTPDDTIHLDVINTGSGFKVTSQNSSSDLYFGNTTESVFWDVVGTNAVPINSPDVDIYLSEDGGYTWPYHLGTFPNTGSANITFPNPSLPVSAARIKVKGSGNVFFNVNAANFALIPNDGSNRIQFFPVPAHDLLHVFCGVNTNFNFVIHNAIGQKVGAGAFNGQLELQVHTLPKGMYYATFIGEQTGEKVVKSFVLQ